MTDPEPIESLTSPPIVGRFYVVPCLVPRKDLILPVIGPQHSDPDHGINADFVHQHADFRFMDAEMIRALVLRRIASAEGLDAALLAARAPIESLVDFGVGNLVHTGEPLKNFRHLARRCLREMPRSPVPLRWQKELEAAYAGRYLAPGGLCPHRGAPLLSLPLHGGRRVCPLHGLCFDSRGQQCPQGVP